MDLSSGLVREGQKDIQLANLREQMRQLLAIQTGAQGLTPPAYLRRAAAEDCGSDGVESALPTL